MRIFETNGERRQPLLTGEAFARSAFRAHQGRHVRYAARETSLGPVGLAWTERGLSDLFFVESADGVEARVAALWQGATRERAEPPAELAALLGSVERPASPEVSLDLQGTRFQARVWEALLRIPRGETRTYSDVARELGMPRAHRAVARAIGQNRIAVLIPCHRVLGKDGALTGYRWGIHRKAELLRREGERP